jgi:hypothetical protein
MVFVINVYRFNQQVLIGSHDINFGFNYLIDQSDLWDLWNMLYFWIPVNMSWKVHHILVEL